MAATSSVATSLESARLEGLLDGPYSGFLYGIDPLCKESHAALALVA